MSLFDLDKIYKAPKLLRPVLLSSISLPVWYVALHLFSKELFEDSDLILRVAYCISLAFGSMLITGITSLLMEEMRPDKKVRKHEDRIDDEVITAVMQNLLLFMLIFTGVILIEFTNLEIKLLYLIFSYLAFSIVLLLFTKIKFLIFK